MLDNLYGPTTKADLLDQEKRIKEFVAGLVNGIEQKLDRALCDERDPLEGRQMISVREFHKLTGMPLSTITYRCRSGEIEATQASGHRGRWMIPVREVKRLLDPFGLHEAQGGEMKDAG